MVDEFLNLILELNTLLHIMVVIVIVEAALIWVTLIRPGPQLSCFR